MDRQPDRARSALTTINEVSGQALVELRSVLGVLRAVDESVPGRRRLGWHGWATWQTPRPPPGSPSASRKAVSGPRCQRTLTWPPTGSSRRP